MSYKQKIEETLSRSVCGGWDRGFLESILSQMSKDKKLSVKQKQTLGKVLARNTAEAQKFHEGWRETYNKDYKADARVLATYHKQQPYYRNMAEDILSDRVPERSRFLRMYENKYSKKVLSQYHIAPRYATGEYVVPRAGLDSYKHIEFQGDMVWTNQNRIVTNFKKRGGFILEICEEIKNAAKGAKRYKLLTIGETEPIIIEERYIKRAPKVSK
jgi:hypothetical protein